MFCPENSDSDTPRATLKNSSLATNKEEWALEMLSDGCGDVLLLFWMLTAKVQCNFRPINGEEKAHRQMCRRQSEFMYHVLMSLKAETASAASKMSNWLQQQKEAWKLLWLARRTNKKELNNNNRFMGGGAKNTSLLWVWPGCCDEWIPLHFPLLAGSKVLLTCFSISAKLISHWDSSILLCEWFFGNF